MDKVKTNSVDKGTKDTFFSRNFGLVEPFADSDGLYDGCIAPPDQAAFLYWASYIGGVTGLIGIYFNHVWLGAGVVIGSFIAQLYWSKPMFCWRRTLDMSWIQVLIWSHIWALYSGVTGGVLGGGTVMLYLAIQALGVICYATSWWFHKIGVSWGATIFHFLLHLCANISLIVLYTA